MNANRFPRVPFTEESRRADLDDEEAVKMADTHSGMARGRNALRIDIPPTSAFDDVDCATPLTAFQITDTPTTSQVPRGPAELNRVTHSTKNVGAAVRAANVTKSELQLSAVADAHARGVMPPCTCEDFVHTRECPRYALRVTFREGEMLVVGASEPLRTAPSITVRAASPPTDGGMRRRTNAMESERPQGPFTPNASLKLNDGKEWQAQYDEDMGNFQVKTDGRVLMFRKV